MTRSITGPQRAHRTIPAVFIQFSDRCLTSDGSTRDYYRRSYARMAGYHLPEHFVEIPYWIPTVASMLPDDAYSKEMLIVEDVSDAYSVLSQRTDNPILFMSVMDASLSQSCELMATGHTAIVGGYTGGDPFRGFDNVIYCDDPGDLAHLLPGIVIDPSSLDYRLFEGFACIPRLSMSSGCRFRCAFCTVPTKVVTVSADRLTDDISALSTLSYKLVFIDDKSFGQAPNWRMLGFARDMICDRCSDFLGFIVQTPPSIAARRGFLEECYEMGVRYVEFGVETADATLLRWLRKPFSIEQLNRACALARDVGMYVIPNLIVGIPGDDCSRSIAWLEDHVDIIPVVNVNWLAIHHGNVRGSIGLADKGIADRDQNSSSKSWLSLVEEARARRAVQRFYDVTDIYWRGRRIELQRLACART